MERKGVDQLIQKYLNEPAFRTKMEKDFEGAIKSSGISLSHEELEAVRNQILATTDEALKPRVSKGGIRN